MGLAYRFRGSVHYHQGRSMAASRQAWCRRSWEFYVFIQRLLVEDWLPGNWGESLKPTPTVTHPFQPGHTSRRCHSLLQEYTNHHSYVEPISNHTKRWHNPLGKHFTNIQQKLKTVGIHLFIYPRETQMSVNLASHTRISYSGYLGITSVAKSRETGQSCWLIG